MKVIMPETRGYSTYTDFQFAYIPNLEENKAEHLETCKELFSNHLGVEFKDGTTVRRFRFLLLYTGSDKTLNVENTQNFLNQAEKELGFSRSKVWDVSENAPEGTQVLLIESSTAWMRTSPMAHVLLLLARNGSGHDPATGWKNTLANFRRTEAFKVTDTPQFIILNDVLDHVIEKRGRLANLCDPQRANNAWQHGFGICQWAAAYKAQQEVDQ